MRPLLAAVLVLAACAPKVATTPSFDEELETRRAPAPAEAPAPPRPEAPPGKGLRSGTIERAKLVAVLEGGPGTFLRQVEITAHMDGDRCFWQQQHESAARDGSGHDCAGARGCSCGGDSAMRFDPERGDRDGDG